MYTIERLGNTTFALRPEYDAVVAELGYEPPLGVPVECTFEWSLDHAKKVVAREKRAAAAKERAARKRATSAEADPLKPKAVRKTAPRKTAPRKTAK